MDEPHSRAAFLLTLKHAGASFACGEGRSITQEPVRELAREVTERGRARLLAEMKTTDSSSTARN